MPPDKLARLIDEASENNLTIAILTQVFFSFTLFYICFVKGASSDLPEASALVSIFAYV